MENKASVSFCSIEKRSPFQCNDDDDSNKWKS